MQYKYYSENDKIDKLKKLNKKLLNFIDYLKTVDYYKDAADDFAEYNKRIEYLLKNKFNQTDLNNLSYSFKPLINKHKDWIPPFLKYKNGKALLPEWYNEFEKRHYIISSMFNYLKLIGYNK